MVWVWWYEKTLFPLSCLVSRQQISTELSDTVFIWFGNSLKVLQSNFNTSAAVQVRSACQAVRCRGIIFLQVSGEKAQIPLCSEKRWISTVLIFNKWPRPLETILRLLVLFLCHDLNNLTCTSSGTILHYFYRFFGWCLVVSVKIGWVLKLLQEEGE